MKKITQKQAFMLIISMILSPSIRLFSAFYFNNSTFDCWISPILTGLLTAVLIVALNVFTSRNIKFSDALNRVIGKIPAKAVLCVYFLWGTLLTALHLRYSAMRLSSAVYPDIELDIFVLILTFLAIFTVKYGLKTLAQSNMIFLPIMITVLTILLITLSGNIKLDDFWGIYDAGNVLRVSACDLASFSYVTLVVFFNDVIENENRFLKYGLIVFSFVSLFTVWIFITITGTLGQEIVSELPYPFFSAVKEISLGESLQHIEAPVITLWIISDFVIISFLGLTMLKVLSEIINKNTDEIVLPYFFICAALVAFTGKDSRDVEKLSENFFIFANIIMLFVVPIIVSISLVIKEKVEKTHEK